MIPKASSMYGPKGFVYIWSQRLCPYMVPKALSIYGPKGSVYIWSHRLCLYTVPKTLICIQDDLILRYMELTWTLDRTRNLSLVS